MHEVPWPSLWKPVTFACRELPIQAIKYFMGCHVLKYSSRIAAQHSPFSCRSIKNNFPRWPDWENPCIGPDALPDPILLMFCPKYLWSAPPPQCCEACPYFLCAKCAKSWSCQKHLTVVRWDDWDAWLYSLVTDRYVMVGRSSDWTHICAKHFFFVWESIK